MDLTPQYVPKPKSIVYKELQGYGLVSDDSSHMRTLGGAGGRIGSSFCLAVRQKPVCF